MLSALPYSDQLTKWWPQVRKFAPQSINWEVPQSGNTYRLYRNSNFEGDIANFDTFTVTDIPNAQTMFEKMSGEGNPVWDCGTLGV